MKSGLEKVIKKYFKDISNITYQPLQGGSINTTFIVRNQKDEYILQKMHSIFKPSLMHNISLVANHVKGKKIKVPKPIKTLDGKYFYKNKRNKDWYRLFSYIPGKTIGSVTSSNQAKEAGKMVGILHSSLLHFNGKLTYSLPHYRDTAFYIKKLSGLVATNSKNQKYKELVVLSKRILIHYQNLPKNLDTLPQRVIHGDLKISNIIFDKNIKKGLGVIDLDTVMYGSIILDMGDGLRSWCMEGGEDVDIVIFNKKYYKSAVAGYLSEAKFLTKEEAQHIPDGVKLITLELAARFSIDAFEEKYFMLDKSKYKNLFEQNKKRASNQLKFFEIFFETF
ncbi:MAG: phosphotransferase enzyme family protein [Candidatus Paceibacterota bacterium]